MAHIKLLKKDFTAKIKANTLKESKALKDKESIDNEFYYYINLEPKPESPAPRFHGQTKIFKSFYTS